jgi:hypothetical protein
MKNKKLLLLILPLISLFIFSGCKKNDLEKVSKNLSTYTMDITYNDNHTIDVKQNLNYRNNYETSLDNIKFHLYPNCFREGAKSTVVSTLNYSKCYSKCNVTTSGAQYSGMIGALKSSDNATMVKVTECWYSGNVKCTANLNCGGGIVGRAYTPAEVTKCWSEGDINAYTNIGGIIGYSNCALTVANCYSTMSLNSNGGQSAGGIMGSPNPSGAYLKIENCYATGTIQGKCALGGVVAMIQIDAIPDNFEFTLKNCVYWGTSITTNTTDPTNYSSGAIFGNIRDAKKDHASKMVSRKKHLLRN